MEGQSEAFQAREWLTAANPLPCSGAEYSPGRFRFWGVLSSSGGARTEKNVRADGYHAQNGGSSNSLDENGRGLRSSQSLDGEHQLGAPLAGAPRPDPGSSSGWPLQSRPLREGVCPFNLAWIFELLA